jgi:hypothetical protein
MFEALRASVKHMLEHPYNFDWTVQGFGMKAFRRGSRTGIVDRKRRHMGYARAH